MRDWGVVAPFLLVADRLSEHCCIVFVSATLLFVMVSRVVFSAPCPRSCHWVIDELGTVNIYCSYLTGCEHCLQTHLARSQIKLCCFHPRQCFCIPSSHRASSSPGPLVCVICVTGKVSFTFCWGGGFSNHRHPCRSENDARAHWTYLPEGFMVWRPQWQER